MATPDEQRRAQDLAISVIVPAHQAEHALTPTLDTLLAQTHERWEAIVVDDGSTDATLAVARMYGERDARVRSARQAWGGVSTARNRGLDETGDEWLFFLDAGDTIAPDAFARMTARLAQRPELDGVHGAWERITPGGESAVERCAGAGDDLFAIAARTCPFVIHAVLIRRRCVAEVGGFDPGLSAFEDWDLWQRVLRAGARLGALDEVVASYRMRRGSAALHGRRMLRDGLAVIDRGHGRDPRVHQPAERFAEGCPKARLGEARLGLASYVAGLSLGFGDDAAAALEALREAPGTATDPASAVFPLYMGVVHSGAASRAQWSQVPTELLEGLREFLRQMEGLNAARGRHSAPSACSRTSSWAGCAHPGRRPS